MAEKIEKERLGSTDNAVLWIRHIESAAVLMVAYASGLVTFWDLEKHVRTHDLSLQELGPVLAGMKLKGEKARALAEAQSEKDASTGAEQDTTGMATAPQTAGETLYGLSAPPTAAADPTAK